MLVFGGVKLTFFFTLVFFLFSFSPDFYILARNDYPILGGFEDGQEA